MRIIEFEAAASTARKYNLHLQCCWRLQKENSILTGATDHYFAAGPGDGTNRTRETLQDVKMRSFLEHQIDAGSRVQSVSGDTFGGAEIRFSTGESLVIFPAGSTGEAWRFFEPGSANPHLVVYAHAVEWE